MAPERGRREVWLLADSGQLVQNIHPAEWCSGTCVVHRPSDHHMRKLELSFDIEKKAFQRTCKHGALHHDPDERIYWTNILIGSKDRSRSKELAYEKLASWACPLCPCGCCDLTKRL